MPRHQPARVIDTHQHLWAPSEREYSWLTPELGPIYADFRYEDVQDSLHHVGITDTVLVQAADTYEDTFSMLSIAERFDAIAGIVAWAPLDRTDEATAAFELYQGSPHIVGLRVLNHSYEDPRWLLRDDVSRSIGQLDCYALSLDVVSGKAEDLTVASTLAKRHPEITIVLDHIGHPPVSDNGWEPWATMITDVATHPNISAKISGLAPAGAWTRWQETGWQRYVDHALEVFGSDRLMLGSDWPVSLLVGQLEDVWLAQLETITGLSTTEQDNFAFGTAVRAYKLRER